MEKAEATQRVACVLRVGARCMVGVNIGGGISANLSVTQGW